MLLWDKAASKAHFSRRLKKLDRLGRLSFAAGLLRQASEVIQRRSPLQGRSAAVFERSLASVSAVVERKVEAESRPNAEELTDLAEASVRARPDGGSHGHADLLEGGAQLLRLLEEEPAAIDALDAATYGYQAICDEFLQVSGGEKEHLEAEQASDECRAEIAFAEAYLSALESGLRSWSEIQAELAKAVTR